MLHAAHPRKETGGASSCIAGAVPGSDSRRPRPDLYQCKRDACLSMNDDTLLVSATGAILEGPDGPEGMSHGGDGSGIVAAA